MTVDTVLVNAKTYVEGRIVEGAIAVDNGRIVKVAKEANLPQASEKIDLNGCLTLPGLIDVHVHLRGQMRAHEEDFSSGTAAAVAGGVSCILDMPNNEPVTMDAESLRERKRAAEQSILANVGFYSAFPKSVDEIEKVVREGAVAFKLYTAAQVGGLDVDDDEILLQAFTKAGEMKVPVAVHAEDKTAEAKAQRERRSGCNDFKAYLAAHTPKTEAKAVERVLELAWKSKVKIHFSHVSTGKTVSLIERAKRNGLNATCEATPHHLLVTSKSLERNGSLFLTDPPLRSRNIVEQLWSALESGKIDIVASDHAPHLKAAKNADSIWDVKPGVPGLETSLPLLLTKVNEGRLSVADLVRMTVTKPAEVFQLKGYGFLRKGCRANITVVDMNKRTRIDSTKFYSKAKYSPFDGWQVKGFPTKAFVNGQLVMDGGEIVAKGGVGRILRS